MKQNFMGVGPRSVEGNPYPSRFRSTPAPPLPRPSASPRSLPAPSASASASLPGLTDRCLTIRLNRRRPIPALTNHLRIRASRTVAVLLPLLLIGAGAAKAAEVTAESIIDQASALRDASSRVPAGAQVLGSDCSDIALPGLSFRYRCSVRYNPAPSRPGTTPAPSTGGTP